MLAPAPGHWSPLPVLLGATTGGSHQSSGDILKYDEGEQMCHPGVLANSPWFLQFGHGEQDGDYVPFLGRLAFRATLENNNKLA